MVIELYRFVALIWLRATDDVGEELEEMRSEAENQRRMPKVRIRKHPTTPFPTLPQPNPPPTPNQTNAKTAKTRRLDKKINMIIDCLYLYFVF